MNTVECRCFYCTQPFRVQGLVPTDGFDNPICGPCSRQIDVDVEAEKAAVEEAERAVRRAAS